MMTHILLVRLHRQSLLDTNTSQAERYFAQNNNLSPISSVSRLIFMAHFYWKEPQKAQR